MMIDDSNVIADSLVLHEVRMRYFGYRPRPKIFTDRGRFSFSHANGLYVCEDLPTAVNAIIQLHIPKPFAQ